MARKSNAQKAAEAAAALAAEQAATQELAKVETVDGEKVVTDLEPASKEPVEASVDANGEDLGDVSSDAAEAPVIEAGEAVDPTETIVDGAEPADVGGEATVTESPQPTHEEMVAAALAPVDQPTETEIIQEAIDAAVVDDLLDSIKYELEDGFSPILRPTMVGDEFTGYIACPKAVFDTVQTKGWQGLIDSHPAKHALKSILYWKTINGFATVRCMSSSKFADVV